MTVGSGSPEVLERILKAVEGDKRRGRLEVVVAIALSMATLGSTWCGYQARLWGGKQSGAQSAADTAERQAAENTIVGLQLRTQDGLVVLEYWKAMREGDEKTSTTIYKHMRPELRRAVDASIAGGILENPDAQGPLQRAEYALTVETRAAQERQRAGELRTEARGAGDVTSRYVLLTLMLASVLFFGGISGTFSHRGVRRGLASAAVLLFLVGAVELFRLPMLWG